MCAGRPSCVPQACVFTKRARVFVCVCHAFVLMHRVILIKSVCVGQPSCLNQACVFIKCAYASVFVSSVRVNKACLFIKSMCVGRASCVDQAFVLMKLVRLLVL